MVLGEFLIDQKLKKFNHHSTKRKIMKKIKNLYSKMKDISGENPDF